MSTRAGVGASVRPHAGAMTEVAQQPTPPRTTPGERRTWWRETAAGAALVLVDLVAFSWIMSHQVSVFSHQHDDVGRNVNFVLPSDLSQPVQLWVWLLVVANGALLCVRRRTRRAGVALFLAVAGLGLYAGAAWTFALIAFVNEV